MQRKLIAILFIFLILEGNLAQEQPSKNKCLKYNKQKIFNCIKNSLATAFQYQSISSLASFIAIRIGIWLIGFSSLGPVAGSIAAWFQSILGNVIIGSLFSFLQAVAMGKTALLILPSLAIGTIIGIIYLVLSCYKSDTCEIEQKSQNKDFNQQHNKQQQQEQYEQYGQYEQYQQYQQYEQQSKQQSKQKQKQEDSFWNSSWKNIKYYTQKFIDVNEDLYNQFIKSFPIFTNLLAEFAKGAVEYSGSIRNIISDQLENAQGNIGGFFISLAYTIDNSIQGLADLMEFIWFNREILEESFEYAFQVFKEQYYYFQTLQMKINAMQQSKKQDACVKGFLEYLDGIENS